MTNLVLLLLTGTDEGDFNLSSKLFCPLTSNLSVSMETTETFDSKKLLLDDVMTWIQ